ncbi:MAG: TIGR03621 family F420-dependent LLM class oxidoreductase, partial [Acidimicrobiales bacterium]
REAVEQAALLMSRTPEEVAQSPIAIIGTVDEIVQDLRHRREIFGFSYIVVHEAEMEAFAPVVAALAGT